MVFSFCCNAWSSIWSYSSSNRNCSKKSISSPKDKRYFVFKGVRRLRTNPLQFVVIGSDPVLGLKLAKVLVLDVGHQLLDLVVQKVEQFASEALELRLKGADERVLVFAHHVDVHELLVVVLKALFFLGHPLVEGLELDVLTSVTVVIGEAEEASGPQLGAVRVEADELYEVAAVRRFLASEP